MTAPLWIRSFREIVDNLITIDDVILQTWGASLELCTLIHGHARKFADDIRQNFPTEYGVAADQRVEHLRRQWCRYVGAWRNEPEEPEEELGMRPERQTRCFTSLFTLLKKLFEELQKIERNEQTPRLRVHDPETNTILTSMGDIFTTLDISHINVEEYAQSAFEAFVPLVDSSSDGDFVHILEEICFPTRVETMREIEAEEEAEEEDGEEDEEEPKEEDGEEDEKEPEEEDGEEDGEEDEKEPEEEDEDGEVLRPGSGSLPRHTLRHALE